MRESFGALRERQFRLLFTGQIVSLLGDAITGVALAFAVLDLTGSATDLGYVFAAKTIPLVGFLLVGGVFADRLPRRAVMLVADVVRLGTQGAVAALILTHHAQIWEIVVLQAISGTASAFFNPASTGLTPMTVSPERLQQANALRGLSMASTGDHRLGHLGRARRRRRSGLGACARCRELRRQRLLPRAAAAAAARDAAAAVIPQRPPRGLAEFSSRTWVWVIVVAASIGNMMASVFVVLGAFVAKASLGGAGAWAGILAALGAGSLIGGFVALRIHVRRPLFFGSSVLAFLPIPIALLALRAPVVVIAAGALLAGLGNMVFNSLWETALQQHIPPAALSRVSAYDWFGSLAFQPIGLVIAGPTAAALGISTTLWIAAAGSLAIAALSVATPSVRRLEARPAASP